MICVRPGASADTFCVAPDFKTVVSKPAKRLPRDEDTGFRLGADGKVVVVPNPALMAKVVQTDRDACGLTRDDEIVCWSQPYQLTVLAEAPSFDGPFSISAGIGANDLFLADWANLCVLLPRGIVMCSPPSPATSECFLDATKHAACGEMRGAHYDPRTLLKRPLVAVPDIAGARAIRPYASLTYWHNDIEPYTHQAFANVTPMRDGGCALVPDGALCFERDPCPTAKPWRTQRIAGLPAALTSLALADKEGYALASNGDLYVWERPIDACNVQPPTARVFLRGVHDALANECIVNEEPSFDALVCAAMNDGATQCWRNPTDAPVTLSL